MPKPTKEQMSQNFLLCCHGADQIREMLGEDCPIKMVYAKEKGNEIGRKTGEGVNACLHAFVVKRGEMG